MTETLITFETAKLVKQKGFNEPCDSWFFENADGLHNNASEWVNSMLAIDNYSAPSQSKLQKWLRVHNIDITVYPIEMETETRSVFQEIKDKEYEYYISIGGVQQFDTIKIFTTYEDALEAGLLEGLKRIK